jgi:hypothetical protein
VIFGIVAGATSYAMAWLVAAGMLVAAATIVAVSRRGVREPTTVDHSPPVLAVEPANVT